MFHPPRDDNGQSEAAVCSSGTVFLDSVTVELTTGADLVAKPYSHSVSGRHMMLSQAGTLWKATRSDREKRFYTAMVAAATQHWGLLDAVTASGSDQQAPNEAADLTSGGVESRPSHRAYSNAAKALLPFLPRFYGTRNVACLKVGSIGFSDAAEEDNLRCPGEYETASTVSRDGGDGRSLAGKAGSVGSRLGSCGTSPLQMPLSSQPSLNASRVVIHTDAVKRVMAQFAKDKRDSLADLQSGKGDLGGGGAKASKSAGKKKSSGSGKGNSEEEGQGAVCASVGPGSVRPIAAGGDAAEKGAKGEGDSCLQQLSPSIPCDDVVAVATAQIAEELGRRLPPRHPDPGHSVTSNPSNNGSFQANHSGTSEATPGTSSPPPTAAAAVSAVPPLQQAKGPWGSGNALPVTTETSHEEVRNSDNMSFVNNNSITGPGEGWVEMIVLQDVCYGFKYPCVMDVKMGTRQYGMHAKPEKIEEKEHKAAISTSKQYGVRLAGFKRWSATHQSFEVKSKHDLFTLPFDQVCAMLQYFLSSYQPPSEPSDGSPGASGQASTPSEAELAELANAKAEKKAAVAAATRSKLADQLSHLLEAFKANGLFRFYTSSLLLAYDAADPVGTCRAVMVDFAYVYEQQELAAAGDPDAGLSVDEGYITGIESLIEALRMQL